MCAGGVLIALVTIVLMAVSFLLDAADVRGRVDGRNAYYPRPFPLAGVPVTLYVRQPPARWQATATSYTGSDGIYHFRGVAEGSYMLQVQGMNFPISVSRAPFQDIPPLLVPR